MSDLTWYPLLNPNLPHHLQLPSDLLVWAARGDVITQAGHLHTEREARLNRREASRSDLERLTQ